VTDPLTEGFQQSHPRSAELNQRAKGFFAAQGATHFARVKSPFRPYIVRAAGSRKWDVDGNEYLDYVMGHGALVLGHGHPAVVAAIQRQAANGIHFGDNHPLELEWAERIRSLMPIAERVEYCASGQEANQMGIRIARAFTGRRKLLKFKHNYHGWADELCAEGSPGALADYVTVIPANDLGLVERHLASREFAVVLIEGAGGRVGGRVPTDPEFFRALPDLARRYGTVLLLDEVVTGFREAVGGWQSVVGMRPDLTTVGKATSGGLPCGVLLGSAEVMSVLSPTTSRDKLVVHGGTWNAVPVTCAAGIAACDLYRDGAPQRAARQAADLLRCEGNAMFDRLRVPARLYGRSVVHIYLGESDRVPADDTLPPTTDPAKLMAPDRVPLYQRLDLHLLARGVSTMRGEGLIVSAAHSSADIERTVGLLEQALVALRDEGSLDRAA
jgi:glutamate-1-semialdehyde 2,1-aminomutase